MNIFGVVCRLVRQKKSLKRGEQSVKCELCNVFYVFGRIRIVLKRCIANRRTKEGSARDL